MGPGVVLPSDNCPVSGRNKSAHLHSMNSTHYDSPLCEVVLLPNGEDTHLNECQLSVPVENPQ